MWLADPDGSQRRAAHRDGRNPRVPPLVPRRQASIAFHSNPDGQAEVFVVAADGGRPRNLTSHPAADTFPASRATAAGSTSARRAAANPIWKMPASGGTAGPVSPGVGIMAIESSDGASLYSPAPARRVERERCSSCGSAAVRSSCSQRVFDQLRRRGRRRPLSRGESRRETRLSYFDLDTAVDGGRTRSRHRRLRVGRPPDGRAVLYPRVDSSVDDLMLVENFR